VTTLHRRLRAQLLTGTPASDPVAVAERLLAIQAQDPRGARLAIRARSRGLHAADIDGELTDRRSLLITWLNRGTLHLIRAEDYPLLQSLTTPPLRTAVARRLAQEGVAPDVADRAVALIDRTLGEEGPMTRPGLRERLQRAGLPVAGQAYVHLLVRASIDGLIVRGPMIGREHALVRVGDWLAPTPVPARPAALAELARRYLAGHGPACDRDLARWAGITLGDARAGLTAIAAGLRSRAGGLVELSDAPGRAGRAPRPRLLGAFEPLLLGWTSRAEVLGPHDARIVTGGIFRGFALVGGRAAAGWRFAGSTGARPAPGARLVIEPFGPLADGDRAALEADAAALHRFLGGASSNIRPETAELRD
jgi:hypothetical protein